MHTDAAVAEARATLAQALAEHSLAFAALQAAIDTVLYGPLDDGETLPDITHSNASLPPLVAQPPSPAPAPGG
ncbi:hypothetical protein ACH4C6_07565 [Streptomyces sp. NPDC017943]|uniref:hypothetical protein n=1 Tax=Streptomyces sp. NPDC017943 TaxID=3365019 RepID=UPI0037B83074